MNSYTSRKMMAFIACFALAFSIIYVFTLLFQRNQPIDGRIVFVNNNDGKIDLYVMSANGDDRTALTNDACEESGPSWSPDGKSIVFAAKCSGDREIYVIRDDGSDRRRLTDSIKDDYMPYWSPNGENIVFVSDIYGDPHIFTMTKDGRNRKLLTDSFGRHVAPSWSPDGKIIAFASDREGQGAIYTMTVGGREQHRVASIPPFDWSPDWSPDGKQIAFMSARDSINFLFISARNTNIYVMDQDGSNPRQLTDGSTDYSPSWSPDGNYIVFERMVRSCYFCFFRKRNNNVVIVRADGTGEVKLSKPGMNDYDPDWSN